MDRGLSESCLEITAGYDLPSDHSPVIATVSEEIIAKPRPPHLHTRTTNWEKYRELIRQGANVNIRLRTPPRHRTCNECVYHAPPRRSEASNTPICRRIAPCLDPSGT